MANNMFLRFASQRVLLSVVFLFCLLALLASFSSLPQRAANTSPIQPHQPIGKKPIPADPAAEKATSKHPRCEAFADLLNDTLIIVKTGANEVYEKLPTQLLTALECYDDLLIFSDLKQRIGEFEIIDALENVTESVKANTKEFDYYRTLQAYKKDRQEISKLKDKMGKDAWNLDKFKFLHMLEKTWQMRPGKKWYVFVEADSYLVQSNLLLWLKQMDPTKPLYLGSPTYINGEAFSHGGSGYILSGKALEMFANNDEGIAQRYDEKMKQELYGDYMLMKALRDKGVSFSKVWPMLQAEKPSALPFGKGPDNGVRHWCQPIVTMHHITSDEASRLFEFEGRRSDIKKPLLLRELYDGFIAPRIQPVREDWYNLSDDVQYRAPGVNGDRQKKPEDMTALEKEAYSSFEACGKACVEQERCYQYVYSDKTCGFSYSFRLGHTRVKEGETTFKSGFVLDKIKKFAETNSCSEPEWLFGN